MYTQGYQGYHMSEYHVRYDSPDSPDSPDKPTFSFRLADASWLVALR